MTGHSARPTKAVISPATGLTDPVNVGSRLTHRTWDPHEWEHTRANPEGQQQSIPALIQVEWTRSQMSRAEGCLPLLSLTGVYVHPMSQAQAAGTPHHAWDEVQIRSKESGVLTLTRDQVQPDSRIGRGSISK